MINLVSEGCIKVNDELIMVARGMNLIYKVDIEKGKLVILGSIPDENLDAGRVGGEILKYEDEIVFLPMNARHINIYDTCKKKWRHIEFEEIKDCYLDKFFSGVIYGKYLYMIGSKYPAIVKVNLQNNCDIKYIKIPYEIMDHEKDDCFIRRDIVVVDEKLYMASCVNNYVFELDLKSENIKKYEVCDKSKTFSGIAYDGRDYWLASRRNREVYRWNLLDEKVECFDFGKDKDDSRCFGGVVFDGKQIVVYGMEGNKSIIINPQADNIVEDASEINESFSFVKIINDNSYSMTFDGKLVEVKSFDDLSKMNSVSVLVEENSIYEYIKKNGAIVHENPFLSLEGFLDGIIL